MAIGYVTDSTQFLAKMANPDKLNYTIFYDKKEIEKKSKGELNLSNPDKPHNFQASNKKINNDEHKKNQSSTRNGVQNSNSSGNKGYEITTRITAASNGKRLAYVQNVQLTE